MAKNNITAEQLIKWGKDNGKNVEGLEARFGALGQSNEQSYWNRNNENHGKYIQLYNDYLKSQSNQSNSSTTAPAATTGGTTTTGGTQTPATTVSPITTQRNYTLGHLEDASKRRQSAQTSYPEYLTSKSTNTGNFTSSNFKNQKNWNSVDSLYDYISNQSLTNGGRSKDNLVTFFQQYDPTMFNNSQAGRDRFTELMRQNGIRNNIRGGDRRQLESFIRNQLYNRSNMINEVEQLFKGVDLNNYLATDEDPVLDKKLKEGIQDLRNKYGITDLYLPTDMIEQDKMDKLKKRLGLEDLTTKTYNNANNTYSWQGYSFKNGGRMTQKYQTGGAAPAGDPQEQIIQLVQAAMQGDQQATAQIQQIMQAAQQGDPQAGQIAEMIMQVMNQMQGGAPQAARNGAKLNYIKRLKGECPEGYEMAYFKAGGKVCKKCQKVMKNCGGGKSKKACGGLKFHRAGGIMEDILTEIFAKGGAMNRNKHTAFGEERGANVVSTNHAGRWGGRRAFNANGTHQLNTHDKPNKFTAFGDEGKKKPTNVGLVGHKATGKTGRMQNRQKAGVTYKATAFGGEKQKRFHRGAKASSIGRIGSISGYPKGHGGKSGIGRI